MKEGFILIAAIGPAILTMLWFWGRDKDRVAASLLWEAFFVGACSAIPVVALFKFAGLDFANGYDPVASAWLGAFFGAAIPEELTKLAVIIVVAQRHIDRCFPYDFVVVGAAAAGGFAAFENIAYILMADSQILTALVRAKLSVPSHVFDGVIIGCGLALRDMDRKMIWPLFATVLSITLHGLFDAPLLLSPYIEGLQATAWHFIIGHQIPMAIVLLEALVAATLSAYILRRESRTTTRSKLNEASRWYARLEKWAWIALGLILLVFTGLFIVAAATTTTTVSTAPVIAILLLYACGAIYQARTLHRANKLPQH